MELEYAAAIGLSCLAACMAHAQDFRAPPLLVPMAPANATYSADIDGRLKLVMTSDETCLPPLNGSPLSVSATVVNAQGFDGQGPMVERARPDCYKVTYRMEKTCAVTDMNCVNSRPQIALVPTYATRIEQLSFTVHVPPSQSVDQFCPTPSEQFGPICPPPGQRVRLVQISSQGPVAAQLAAVDNCVGVTAQVMPGTFRGIPTTVWRWPVPAIYYNCRGVDVNFGINVVYDVLQAK